VFVVIYFTHIMAIISKKDFCAAYQIKSGDLSNYIKRNKIIASADSVDTDNEINQAFITRRLAKLEGEKPVKKEVAVKKIPGKKGRKPIEKPVIVKERVRPVVQNATKTNDLIELDRQTKAANLDKIRLEAENKRLRNEQLLGKTIPTDQVRAVIKQHNVSVVNSFRNAADLLIGEFAKKRNLNLEEQAYFNKALIEIINTAAKDSVAATMRSIDSILALTMEKREKGERKTR
jgi:hypothetical protein